MCGGSLLSRAGGLGDARVADTTRVGAGAWRQGVPQFRCRAGAVSDTNSGLGPCSLREHRLNEVWNPALRGVSSVSQ